MVYAVTFTSALFCESSVKRLSGRVHILDDVVRNPRIPYRYTVREHDEYSRILENVRSITARHCEEVIMYVVFIHNRSPLFTIHRGSGKGRQMT